MSNTKSLHILHLFPDLLNLYGDKGNLACMTRRLTWRGYDVKVTEYTCVHTKFDLSDVDIVFIGGGSDREQKMVCHRLLEHKQELQDYVENNGVLVAVCGGYQLLGKYYKTDDETLPGLEILNIYTEQGTNRLIGNIILENDLFSKKIVGFENHGGRTYIGNHTPLGKVMLGYGNDELSQCEGVLYKNVIATYLHGPLFPKNPELCDYILTNALKQKYADFTELSPLDDNLEQLANDDIVNRFLDK